MSLEAERALVLRAMGSEGAPKGVVYGRDGLSYLDSWENGGMALGALGDGVRAAYTDRGGIYDGLQCSVRIVGTHPQARGTGRTLSLAACACAVSIGRWPGGEG